MLKSRLTLFLPILALIVAAFMMLAPMPQAFAQEELVTGSSDVAAEQHAGEHAEEKLGFPQLDTSTYATQVFWLAISFILLYGLMSKLALPRVGKVIDTRQNVRDGDLSRAQTLQEEAARIKTAYDATLAEAQGRAQDAMTNAELAVSEKNAADNAVFADHARKRLVTAEQNINRAKNDALQSLADIAADVAADMVNKISGAQVTKADARKVVATVMQEGS
jgi:F-type H+-transporting ATPase subunit b